MLEEYESQLDEHSDPPALQKSQYKTVMTNFDSSKSERAIESELVRVFGLVTAQSSMQLSQFLARLARRACHLG